MNNLELAFDEMKELGFEPRADSNGNFVFRISRDAKGSWFVGRKNGYNYSQDRDYLSFKPDSGLKTILDLAVKNDGELFTLGGRVFLSPNQLYKKKGNEVFLLVQ